MIARSGRVSIDTRGFDLVKVIATIRNPINSVSLSLLALLLPMTEGQANDIIEAAGRFTVKITSAVDYSFGNEKKRTSRWSVKSIFRLEKLKLFPNMCSFGCLHQYYASSQI